MSHDNEAIGAVLTRLERAINDRKSSSADESYTASLLAGGLERCAKKFGEEAVETVIAGAMNDKAALTEEAADVLYHLFVLLAAADVPLGDVGAVLQRREGTSGHAEKASRQ